MERRDGPPGDPSVPPTGGKTGGAAAPPETGETSVPDSSAGPDAPAGPEDVWVAVPEATAAGGRAALAAPPLASSERAAVTPSPPVRDGSAGWPR